MSTEQAYIGIGSNLGDPASNVQGAVDLLAKVSYCELIEYSSLYQSEPLGDIAQDDYVNAVAALKTSLQPAILLLELQAIEKVYHRQRDPALRWGPRTLDLDIILYGNHLIDGSGLTIPHPEMHNRLFVLKPLFEISGEMTIPGLGSLRGLIDRAPAIEINLVKH